MNDPLINPEAPEVLTPATDAVRDAKRDVVKECNLAESPKHPPNLGQSYYGIPILDSEEAPNPGQSSRFRCASVVCLLAVLLAAASAGVIRWQDHVLDTYERMLVSVDVSDEATNLGIQPTITWLSETHSRGLGVLLAEHNDWGRGWDTWFRLLVQGREGDRILAEVAVDGYRKVEIAVPYGREVQSVAVKLGRIHEE
jgi:hypothetical protein